MRGALEERPAHIRPGTRGRVPGVDLTRGGEFGFDGGAGLRDACRAPL